MQTLMSTAHAGQVRHFLAVSDLLKRHQPTQLQVPQHLRCHIACIYVKQGMLTGNMAAPVMHKWLSGSQIMTQKAEVINKQG